MLRRIDFKRLTWSDPAEGARAQTVQLDGRQLRVVEFAPGFCETQWCDQAHVGYVLAGRLEIEFRDAVEVYSSGEGLLITVGDAHRARVLDGPVRLFLVEDA